MATAKHRGMGIRAAEHLVERVHHGLEGPAAGEEAGLAARARRQEHRRAARVTGRRVAVLAGLARLVAALRGYLRHRRSVNHEPIAREAAGADLGSARREVVHGGAGRRTRRWRWRGVRWRGEVAARAEDAGEAGADLAWAANLALGRARRSQTDS
jgi:hypothetical protein